MQIGISGSLPATGYEFAHWKKAHQAEPGSCEREDSVPAPKNEEIEGAA